MAVSISLGFNNDGFLYDWEKFIEPVECNVKGEVKACFRLVI